MEKYLWLSEISSLEYGLKYHFVLWECGRDVDIAGMFKLPFDVDTDQIDQPNARQSSVVHEQFLISSCIWTPLLGTEGMPAPMGMQSLGPACLHWILISRDFWEHLGV